MAAEHSWRSRLSSLRVRTRGGMGQGKNKKRRFLQAHPWCCFCGGTAPATTVDHIPARTCFPERAPPDGFEFPACARCQTASRVDELAFGNFVRMTDPNPDNYRSEDARKSYSGISNNLPHLLPRMALTSRDKRRALRNMGLAKPPNVALDSLPMVAISTDIDPHIHRYARKMAAALYYKEKGKPIGLGFRIWTAWTLPTYAHQMKGVVEILKDIPFQTIGARPNMNFGDRFGYRFDKADDNDLFAVVAQFGRGVIVTMLIVDDLSAAEMTAEDGDDWVMASAMFE